MPSDAGLALIPSTVLNLSASRVGADPAMAETIDAHDRASSARAVVASRERRQGERRQGRYEQVGLLGEGGMGRVEQVRDRDLLRDVAVKHLRPELLGDGQMLAQFLWEARVTAYLDHPNIVPVHDLGVTPEGHLFFTMKLVRGSTLESVIADARENQGRERFDLTRRLRMFLQLCNAVSFAHAHGVLHRDLKPANVMVGEFGEILVSDWGVALPLSGDAGSELHALMPEGLVTHNAGTPMYMSPEQARGDSLDARSDSFTLGVILYELVALRSPYDATTVPQLLTKVIAAETVPIAQAAPSVSTALAAVVEKALSVDAATRYADVRALAEDVEAVLDGQTPAAEHVNVVQRAARYYVGRDPAMAGLRVVDIDMWMAAGTLMGVAIGMAVARWVAPAAWVVSTLLVCSCIAAIPTTRRWLRLRNALEKRGSKRE